MALLSGPVLVVNAGSSSLKLSILDEQGGIQAEKNLERWDGEGDLGVIHEVLDAAPDVVAVGHRVVHGGPRLRSATLIDDGITDYLDAMSELAPLHNPRAVAGIRAVGKVLPGLPAVACLDTAFHSTIPPQAATYAIPQEWNERWSLRRYGFHGLSHAYASVRAAELVGRSVADLRIVTCHLGSGASLAAVRHGHSVDTTMGFTPLEGLVMATRSGSIDPGLLLWLLRNGGLASDELALSLEKRSGLAGLSGVGGDMRDVLAARESGDAAATLAFDVFMHRLGREAGAMAAASGLDVLVFTAAIGERSGVVRAALAERLGFLGVALDTVANEAAQSDADISAAGSSVRTVVVAAREDLQIARETRAVLSGSGHPAPAPTARERAR